MARPDITRSAYRLRRLGCTTGGTWDEHPIAIEYNPGDGSVHITIGDEEFAIRARDLAVVMPPELIRRLGRISKVD